MPADRPKKAVVYCRISDARDSDEKGVKDQEADARQLADRLGWTVAQVIVENNVSAFKRRKVHLPDGTAALRVVRPGWRQMLDALASGACDGLIAYDLDRAARDPRDLEDLVDVVESRKPRIPVESVTGSLKLANDADVTMARVMVAVANKSSRDTGRRVSRARLRQALEGEFGGGGHRCFGYERDGVTIRPDEAAEIVKMANDLLAGTSISSILKDLRERGVSTVTGAPWYGVTIRRLLRRPRLAGIAVHQGREAGRGKWPAILPEETWRAVVALLDSPNRCTSPGSTPRWLGSLIFRCGKCDDGTTLRVGSRGRSQPPKYRCTKYHHISRDAKQLDAYISACIVERLSQPDAVHLFQAPSDVVDVDRLHVEATALRQRIKLLAEDVDIDEETLAIRVRALRAKLAEIELEIQRAMAGDPLVDLVNAPDVTEAWLNLPLPRKRAIVKRLMTVTVLPTSLGRKPFNPDAIQIEWHTR